jgi:hypothetical protein
MEYSHIYTILYETLNHTIPTEIITHIIFKYVIESFEYKYKFTILCSQRLYQCHLNKSLGIISCEFEESYMLLDAKTNNTHDGSLIDVETIPIYKTIRYFNDNTIIMCSTYGIYKYVLDNKQYNQTYYNKKYNHNGTCVYNDYVYQLRNFDGNKYQISIYNLSNLKQIKTMHYTTETTARALQISVYDDYIYVYDGIKYIYIHNTKLNYIGVKSILCLQKGCQLHKNKLYYHESKTIYVYDIQQLTCICSFQTTCDDDYELIVSDDILTLNNSKCIVFYDIK